MRGTAYVAYRQARATELALAGHDYDTIARELGYANRSGAWKAVQRALRGRTTNAVDQCRQEQLVHLDRVMAAQWDDAMTGNVRAAHAVLRAIEQRVRLLGLGPAQET